MKKVFAEIGFGNDIFFSTEIEEGDNEYRIPKFIKPQKISGYYFCFWIFKKVFIFSSKDNISHELKTGGDGYFDLKDINEFWGKDLKHRANI